MTELTFCKLVSEQTMIHDTKYRPCPECGVGATHERGIWRPKVGGVPQKIELAGYHRLCSNGHQWRAPVLEDDANSTQSTRKGVSE